MASGAEGELEQNKSAEAAATTQLQQTGVGEAEADDQCSICLGKINKPAYINGCFHTFCFGCIWEWAFTRPVCPLCRQPFNCIRTW